MRFSKRIFWASVLALITFMFGFTYVVVQQSLRMGANEPQRSMVQDAVAALNKGATPSSLAVGHADMNSGTAPFVIIYDKSGKVVAGNGYLDGKVPQIPIGVLRASSPAKDNSVTWQPSSTVRIASVSQEANNYYVVGGRSLAVTEGWISSIGNWLFIGWIVSLALVLLLIKLVDYLPRPKRS